jgi:hypothetical protein
MSENFEKPKVNEFEANGRIECFNTYHAADT